MATPYSEVFDVFLRRVSDYSFLNLTQIQLESTLQKYMTGSIAKVKIRFADNYFARDDIAQQFVDDIDDTVKEILGGQMVVEWLSPTINTSEIIRQVLTDRDFKIYSQANHLAELIKLRDNAKDEVDGLLISFTYNKTGMEELQ
jgi:hypothetical protein